MHVLGKLKHVYQDGRQLGKSIGTSILLGRNPQVAASEAV